MMKIGVVGCGYVGLSLAAMLARKNQVALWDTDRKKLECIERLKCPFKDVQLEAELKKGKFNFRFWETEDLFYSECNVFFIAVPTDYNEKMKSLSTENVESVIDKIIGYSDHPVKIIIKSTVPIGYTEKVRDKFKTSEIYYMPEFLREGHAFSDMIRPSRLVIGGQSDQLSEIVTCIKECSLIEDEDICFMTATEAEGVKLFANAYLAMRVGFFNELDSFAQTNNLDSQVMIKAVCKDWRIGDFYHNPSFGYGGYCLPKDTKQLVSDCNEHHNQLLQAIVSSNQHRKDYIVNTIRERGYKRIGIYRLNVKMDSDNIRQSAMYDIMRKLASDGMQVFLYEPYYEMEGIKNICMVPSVEVLSDKSEIILANRVTEEIMHYREKIYSRDLFHKD